jgi:hypothetical protein
LASHKFPSTKNLFQFDSTSTPRWSSFENPNAEKGKGAMKTTVQKGIRLMK